MTGWSGRMQKSAAPKEEPTLPAEIYQVDSIPHDWLFPQLDAAMHHGGAGVSRKRSISVESHADLRS